MWVTNQKIGALAQRDGVKSSTGQWLNAELDSERKLGDKEMLICTIADKGTSLIDGKIKHIVLPHGNIVQFRPTDTSISDWKEVLIKEAPNVIIVWGTECAVGQAVLLANQQLKVRIPAAVYIQGVMKSIYDNYRGGFSKSEIKGFTTLVERIRHTTLYDLEQQYLRNYERERKVIALSDYVIVENQWAENIYREMNSRIKVLKNRLPIREVFFQTEWHDEDAIKHRIITTAAGYPLKGLHQLIKAIGILKREYPDVELVVPGKNSFFVNGFREKISQHGFNRYIHDLIVKKDLVKNIRFVGSLTSDEYAEQMRLSEVFVCSSAIENHSSTLREAMSIGLPCVSTAVGGIPEFAVDEENCLLYQFSNADELANKIRRLFASRDLRNSLSLKAKEKLYEMYNVDTLLTMPEIYEKMREGEA